MMDRANEIDRVLCSLSDLIKEKNKRYGDSALSPVGIFAANIKSGDAIRIRLDDKLARIRNSGQLRKNDVSDLMGYLTLLCMSEGWNDFSDLID
jgi:hypothetical protein